MTGSQIVQIRKKGGLNKILKTKQGTTINPVLYSTKTKDPNEEGVIEGDYRGRTILDTKHFIAPIWNDLNKRWSFEGTTNDLVRLVTNMKLRYPKNHKRAGELVKPGDNPVERLINRSDDVFNHPELYGKFFMENGRISLNMVDPKQEFLYRCYKGDTAVQDKSSDKPMNKFIAAGTKYELVSPKKENQKAKKVADREIEAIQLLAAMGGNEDRMRAVAKIMALPHYNDSTDFAGLFVLLKDSAAQNTTMSAKYNKTYQDRFIELAKLDDDTINIHSQVIEGKARGHLRRRQGFYLMNGERIDGIDSDHQLINFFLSPKNQEKYLELLDLLSDGDKQ